MKTEKEQFLKLIKKGIRLKSKPPKIETPKTVYSRKKKDGRKFDDDSSIFIFSAPVNIFFSVL
ncbi:MAG: hypothetical protein KBH06_10475 [Spirochaetes bacterium]|nr:hypothetical protein [Spirochaetota bacterium]